MRASRSAVLLILSALGISSGLEVRVEGEIPHGPAAFDLQQERVSLVNPPPLWDLPSVVLKEPLIQPREILVRVDKGALVDKPHKHHKRHTGSTFHWVLFSSIILVVVLIEVFILKSYSRDLSAKDAFAVLALWVLGAFVFGLCLYGLFGKTAIVAWCNGYLLEMTLSIDNLFLFVLIMQGFKVPGEFRGKVLMWGVLAALLLRVVMFSAIHFLVAYSTVVTKILGGFIIYCAYKTVVMDEEEDDIEDNPVVSFMMTYLPMTRNDGQGSFIVDGKGTPMLIAVTVLIFFDMLFAIDSVSAKTALIPDLYLNYTSTGFAMFALRAMYYVLESAASSFGYLKYGIGLILVVIGLKTMVPGLVPVTHVQYLVLLISVLASCVLVSVIVQVKQSRADPEKQSIVENAEEEKREQATPCAAG